MKNLLLLISIVFGVCGRKEEFTELLALNKGHINDLQRQFDKEIRCLKKVDSVLKSKWTQDLENVSTSDLGEITDFWEYKAPKSAYNTVQQEWLMDNGSPIRQISTCYRKLADSLADTLNKTEVDCWDNLFFGHIRYEKQLAGEFNNLLKTSSREQLPFRRFISFIELTDLMFQNRSLEALVGIEPSVYSYGESFLSTEEDRAEKTYVIEQECEWKNELALREASGDLSKYDEFVNQVCLSVNQQLASALVKQWDPSTTLSSQRYEEWLKARRGMLQEIDEKVAQHHEQMRNAQWLCNYATKLAYNISEKQAAILLSDHHYFLELSSQSVADKARSIEKELVKRNDTRQETFNVLADEFEEGMKCLSSFRDLITNHQQLSMALLFIDSHHSYPEIFCKEKSNQVKLITPRFCKCIGSFCVGHTLDSFFADQYVMKLDPNGTYKVVPSGLKKNHGIMSWDDWND